jgi:hypothetical protein
MSAFMHDGDDYYMPSLSREPVKIKKTTEEKLALYNEIVKMFKDMDKYFEHFDVDKKTAGKIIFNIYNVFQIIEFE